MSSRVGHDLDPRDYREGRDGGEIERKTGLRVVVKVLVRDKGRRKKILREIETIVKKDSKNFLERKVSVDFTGITLTTNKVHERDWGTERLPYLL